MPKARSPAFFGSETIAVEMEILALLTLNSVIEGHLAGLVGRTCSFSSQGREFKTHVQCRDCLNKYTYKKNSVTIKW